MADVGTDAELVRAAQAGELVSLGLLLERYRAPLRAQAVGLLGPGPAAEDAVHETFLVALSKIQTVREPAAVGGWLRRVLRNACLMQHRRERTEVLVGDPYPHTSTVIAPSAEQELDRLVLRDWVWRAVEDLSEPLRLVIILRYFTGHQSYHRIAEVCGVPVGTIRSRLNEAKRKLAEGLLAETAQLDTDERRWASDRVDALRAAVDDLNHRHDLRAFIEPCADDMTVAADGGDEMGLPQLVAGLAADFVAGVKLHLVNVVASRGITVAEGRFENPASDPTHCPPAAAQLHFHEGGGRTRRLVMRYSHDAPPVTPTA